MFLIHFILGLAPWLVGGLVARYVAQRFSPDNWMRWLIGAIFGALVVFAVVRDIIPNHYPISGTVAALIGLGGVVYAICGKFDGGGDGGNGGPDDDGPTDWPQPPDDDPERLARMDQTLVRATRSE